MEEIASDISAKTLYALAYQAYEKNRYVDASHFFRALTVLEMHEQKHWIGLGACLQMLNRYEEALPMYFIAETIDEENPEVHMNTAECFFALNKRKEANNALKSADHYIAKRPQYNHLRSELAIIRAKWDNQPSFE